MLLEVSSKEAFKAGSRKPWDAAGARCPVVLGAAAAGGLGDLRKTEQRGFSVIRVPSTGLSPQKGLWLRETGGKHEGMVWCGVVWHGWGPARVWAARGTRLQSLLRPPSPRAPLSPGLTVKKTGAAVPKAGARAAQSEPWALPALASPRKARGCDMKEAAVDDDAPAAEHLQAGTSMGQSALSSAEISLHFVRAASCSGLGSRVSSKSLGSPSCLVSCRWH